MYLPENWFDKMKKYKDKYDWYECDRRIVTMFEFSDPNLRYLERALSGSQMGRKKAFEKIITKIDDDYLQRNEDIVFQELIKAEGFKYGRIFETFHYHQLMNKKGENEPKIDNIYINRANGKEWELGTIQCKLKALLNT